VRFVLFYHSLVSDWNHGNAHFLRGICSELLSLGHAVQILEPQHGWSLSQLRREHGERPVEEFHAAYPHLRSAFYDPDSLDLDSVLDGADIVIVHEWTDGELIGRIGRHRACSRYRLLFHDTHHRAVSAPHELLSCDLSGYDGVLAFGEVLRQVYGRRGCRSWVWHEAADTRLFRPDLCHPHRELDLVWVGNWGDGERARELQEFLIEPVRALGLRSRVHGVRYTPESLSELQRAGIEYAGWVANFRVPGLFASARATVHIPRRFYREQLPGIPTIRVFEALACGIPLVSAPWQDTEGLFEAGRDYLVARDGKEMRQHLRSLLADEAYARAIAEHGCHTIGARHTCAHRVRELLAICGELGAAIDPSALTAAVSVASPSTAAVA